MSTRQPGSPILLYVEKLFSDLAVKAYNRAVNVQFQEKVKLKNSSSVKSELNYIPAIDSL